MNELLYLSTDKGIWMIKYEAPSVGCNYSEPNRDLCYVSCRKTCCTAVKLTYVLRKLVSFSSRFS